MGDRRGLRWSDLSLDPGHIILELLLFQLLLLLFPFKPHPDQKPPAPHLSDTVYLRIILPSKTSRKYSCLYNANSNHCCGSTLESSSLV